MNLQPIRIRNLNKQYKDFALSDICIDLNPGDIVGLVGENGAGKTTLLKVIAGLEAADAGKLTGIPDNIGFSFDSIPFSEQLTPLELGRILNGLKWPWSAEVYEKYLDEFQLPLNTMIGKFSKGMKMQLNVAVTLSHGSDLLLLDEITGGLDPLVRDEVLQAISKYVKLRNSVAVMSTHLLSDVEKLCNHLALLDHGSLILYQTTEDFKSSNEIEHTFKMTLKKVRGH